MPTQSDRERALENLKNLQEVERMFSHYARLVNEYTDLMLDDLQEGHLDIEEVMEGTEPELYYPTRFFTRLAEKFKGEDR